MEHKFISGKNNDFITEIRKLKQKKYRNQTGLFYVEGIKLLNEALNSKYRKNIKYIICVGDGVPYVPLPQLRRAGGVAPYDCDCDCDVITVTREIYKKITDEEAFEGIMCVIEKPAAGRDAPGAPLLYDKPVIILVSVRDPGNVGTIIRTANALCDVDIILSDDCADIYSGKTQRAAMGAVFRQSIKISENIEEDIANLKKNGYNIFATHLDKNSRSIKEVSFNSKTAVVFGNEGNGLDEKIVQICDGKIIIPINKNSESLNVSVAAGIVLWEIGKEGFKV